MVAEGSSTWGGKMARGKDRRQEGAEITPAEVEFWPQESFPPVGQMVTQETALSRAPACAHHPWEGQGAGVTNKDTRAHG